MSFEVEIAGSKLEHPLMNAAGTCKKIEDVQELARSATAAIMLGSITLEPREGNSGNVYWAGDGFSLNSLGLPNPGAQYYRRYLPEMADCAHRADKPLWVSVAGLEMGDYAKLTEIALQGGADAVELNLGCPNVWHEGDQKRIACFDWNMVAEILARVTRVVGVDVVVGIKVSPFSDPFNLERVGKVIGQSQLVKFVTAINTHPNAFALDTVGKPRITPDGGLAGLGGLAVKPIGLGQVMQWRRVLPSHIGVVGVGGISRGQDVCDYRRVGAVACQIATALLERKVRVFGEILEEYVEING